MRWQKRGHEVLADAFGFQARRVTFDVSSDNPAKTVVRDMVHHRGTVVCLLEDELGRIAIERIFRPIFGEFQYELPAGGIDSTETPEQAIIREVREEIGAEVTDLVLLRQFQNSPGHSDQITHIFSAKVSSRKEPKREGPEEQSLEVLWMGREEILNLLNSVNDAKTLIGVNIWIRAI